MAKKKPFLPTLFSPSVKSWAVMIKSCLQCNGDLTWRYDEEVWGCLQCGWREYEEVRSLENSCDI